MIKRERDRETERGRQRDTVRNRDRHRDREDFGIKMGSDGGYFNVSLIVRRGSHKTDGELLKRREN